MVIKIIRRRDTIKNVPAKWEKQYSKWPMDHKFRRTGKTIGEIRAKLASLDYENCSPSDIDAAIGVSGWTSITCDECYADCENLVRIGEDPDYNSRWVEICAQCAAKTLDLISSVDKEGTR